MAKAFNEIQEEYNEKDRVLLEDQLEDLKKARKRFAELAAETGGREHLLIAAEALQCLCRLEIETLDKLREAEQRLSNT